MKKKKMSKSKENKRRKRRQVQRNNVAFRKKVNTLNEILRRR